MTALAATASPVDQARAIRSEVEEALKPQSRDARWAMDWALGEVSDALAEYDALLDDDACPEVLEEAADEALERAEAARNRLRQVWADEESRQRKDALRDALPSLEPSTKGEAA